MLIDPYSDNWFDALLQRARSLSPACKLHLLIDGAFVPGLQRRLDGRRKALLFDGLPGSGPNTLDVSPFVLPFDPDSRETRAMLHRCQAWPMVSVIETPEPWQDLAARLAAWCIVEADGQRFNFRFADTRRFPAILKTLDSLQRGQFAGPAVDWSYIARDGTWRTLALDGISRDVAIHPQLDDAQFGALVEDSRADEVLAQLAANPDRVRYRPSQAHALIASALALAAGLPDRELVDWCGWLLANGQADAVPDIAQLFKAWKTQTFSDGDLDALET